MQNLPTSTGKFGVQRQYLDREVDFVDNALSWAVTTGEQFKVARIVMLAVAVDVVHRFFGKQFTPKFLLHNVPMFKNFVRRGSILRWDSKHNVAAFDATRNLLKRSTLRVPLFADPFIFALFAAKFLCVIDRSRAFTAGFVKLLTAVFADRFVTLISVFSPSDGGARSGAVQRVTAKFFIIGCDIRLHHRKRIAAFAACKSDRSYASSRSTIVALMFPMASAAAKFAVRILRLDPKWGLAVFADFLNRHGETPVFLTNPGVTRVVV